VRGLEAHAATSTSPARARTHDEHPHNRCTNDGSQPDASSVPGHEGIVSMEKMHELRFEHPDLAANADAC
jgi:hypothetical protein